jgi:hypothetical protein
LVNNREYDSANFEQKKQQAEDLCRIVVQLKGMIHMDSSRDQNAPKKKTYPTPQQLSELLVQSQCGVFGDPHQETAHTIREQLHHGTSVPVRPKKARLGAVQTKNQQQLFLIHNDDAF